MTSYSQSLLAACSGVAVLAIATTSFPEPAQAQFGGITNAIIGQMVRGGGPRYSSRQYSSRGGSDRRSHSRSKDNSDDSSDADKGSRKDRNDRNDRVLASLAPPSSQVQNEVLKSVSVSRAIGVVGTTKDVPTLGKTDSKEADRDWTSRVERIIGKFQGNQDKRVTTPGDVTQHAIEQSLDKAIKNAKLDRFESFLGENWSSERLRTKVLDRVLAEIDSLFKGNVRGYAPMTELDSLIDRSAQSTYRRVFEVSELLAANRGSALFVQRLYQVHGGLVDDHLRDLADGMITRASNAAIAKFEAALRQDENGFALRYRAQRIVFDCLSANVERISSSETGIATIGEIEQKIDDTGKSECVGWLDNQFGANTRSLEPQRPMPLRVTWSATGPKDDPSMYGRATGGF
jgi:hypothetical protein